MIRSSARRERRVKSLKEVPIDKSDWTVLREIGITPGTWDRESGAEL